MKPDKIKHLFAGYFISLIMYMISKNLLVAISVGIFSGYAKEYLYDIRYPEKHTVEFYDFLYTVCGTVIFFIFWFFYY